MLLSQLLQDVPVKSSYSDREIRDVTADTGSVVAGCAFVCIAGAHCDGHSFAGKALENGAKALIVSKDLGLEGQVLVADTRTAYALMCKNLFGRAVDALSVIGITGTNGKTTTAFVMKNLLAAFGIPAGLLGTVRNMVGEESYGTELTTPDPHVMHAMFGKMKEKGIRYCVMEASSQALHQCRLAGIDFRAGIFTNLTQDHLDYHGTLAEYLSCKKMLFKSCGSAILNADDSACVYMREGIDAEILTYGCVNPADFRATGILSEKDGVRYLLNGRDPVFFPVPGSFSVYNSLAALSCASALGFPREDTVKALSVCRPVPGRMERVETGRAFNLVIDYAHTPDGLEKAIGAVRSFTSGRVITVFGCGGDRDRTKRPKMGSVATAHSDVVVITTDNPRTEAPGAIILDILEGVTKGGASVFVETDRTDAIRKALLLAGKDDTILLAGKGHETYQVLGKNRVPYDEREIIRRILEEEIKGE